MQSDTVEALKELGAGKRTGASTKEEGRGEDDSCVTDMLLLGLLCKFLSSTLF